jgi:hypothetical protein
VEDRCADYPKLLWLMDGRTESNIVPLSTAPMPPLAQFCQRGGRFGAHNLHENDPVGTAWHSEDFLVGAFFNAGVRVFDVRDPFRPEDVACHVPTAPPRSPAGAVQINDVYVDERGVVYALDRHTGGLYTLELKL